MAGGPSKAAVAAARVALRRTHIRRRTPGEKIFTRWREDVHDLGVFGEKTFVLGIAGNNCNIAPDHRTPFVADAEIHFALEHPNDLLVRMLMRTSVRARLDFPPHDHSVLARKNAALNFVIDTLPRQFLERAEPRHQRHDVPSVAFAQNIIAALDGLASSGARRKARSDN